jgi:hypothetical protein
MDESRFTADIGLDISIWDSNAGIMHKDHEILQDTHSQDDDDDLLISEYETGSQFSDEGLQASMIGDDEAPRQLTYFPPQVQGGALVPVRQGLASPPRETYFMPVNSAEGGGCWWFHTTHLLPLPRPQGMLPAARPLH